MAKRTDKKLRHTSRADLIEIIYELRKNEAALVKENEELKAQLEDRHLKAEKAGSLAELSASINGLFEAAQATADQYLSAVWDEAERLRQEINREDGSDFAEEALSADSHTEALDEEGPDDGES